MYLRALKGLELLRFRMFSFKVWGLGLKGRTRRAGGGPWRVFMGSLAGFCGDFVWVLKGSYYRGVL